MQVVLLNRQFVVVVVVGIMLHPGTIISITRKYNKSEYLSGGGRERRRIVGGRGTGGGRKEGRKRDSQSGGNQETFYNRNRTKRWEPLRKGAGSRSKRYGIILIVLYIAGLSQHWCCHGYTTRLDSAKCKKCTEQVSV